MGDAIISRGTDISQKADIKHSHSASDIVSGGLSIEQGGTGATTQEQARKNLNVPYLSPNYYSGDLNNLNDTGFYVIYGKGANTPSTANATPAWLLMVISSNEITLNIGTFQICSEILNTQKVWVWVRKSDKGTTLIQKMEVKIWLKV